MCLLGKKWCRTWCATKGTEKKKRAVYTKHLQCDVLSKNSEMNCGLTLKCNTNVFVWGMSVINILDLRSSPAWIESTLQFHLSPEVGTVHQGKFWLAEKQMERRVHCQGSCRVYKKDVKVVSVFVRGQTLEGNRGEGWTRNKKEYTRMCRHVAKTHIYHDL